MKQELSPAIEDYLRFRHSQDYSKHTLAVDRQVLKKFLATVGNIWCHQIADKHVTRHFDAATKTRAAHALGNDYGVLGRFFAWARHTGRMPVDCDPMYGRRRPQPVRKERNRVHVTDFSRLLDEAGKISPRDRALIAVLLYTLMRDSELCSLRIRDLDLQSGSLNVRVHKSRLEDRMPVSLELDREMRRWLTTYTEQVGHLDPGYFLIPARGVSPVHNELGRIAHHKSIYRPTKPVTNLARLVKPALHKIGFETVKLDGSPANEGAHTIRRSGARALFDALVDGGYDHSLRVVQSMLHHSSVQMTERYIGITADRRSRDELVRGREMYPSTSGRVVQIAR